MSDMGGLLYGSRPGLRGLDAADPDAGSRRRAQELHDLCRSGAYERALPALVMHAGLAEEAPAPAIDLILSGAAERAVARWQLEEVDLSDQKGFDDETRLAVEVITGRLRAQLADGTLDIDQIIEQPVDETFLCLPDTGPCAQHLRDRMIDAFLAVCRNDPEVQALREHDRLARRMTRILTAHIYDDIPLLKAMLSDMAAALAWGDNNTWGAEEITTLNNRGESFVETRYLTTFDYAKAFFAAIGLPKQLAGKEMRKITARVEQTLRRLLRDYHDAGNALPSRMLSDAACDEISRRLGDLAIEEISREPESPWLFLLPRNDLDVIEGNGIYIGSEDRPTDGELLMIFEAYHYSYRIAGRHDQAAHDMRLEALSLFCDQARISFDDLANRGMIEFDSDSPKLAAPSPSNYAG